MKRILFLIAAIVLVTPAAHAANRLASGKWEAAMTADGATKTVTYCITPEEATSINGDSKTGREFAEKKAQKAGSNCAFKSYEIKGNTGSYALACGDRTITDTTVYNGETSEGVKTVTNAGKTITTRLKSRRVGTCP
jgi:Protein of unknown function (DUF3617)